MNAFGPKDQGLPACALEANLGLRGIAMQVGVIGSRRLPALSAPDSRPQGILRETRMPTGKPGEIVQIGDWLVNPALDTLYRDSETNKLEPRMMRLLMCLANTAGTVVSVDHLLTEVWTGVVVGSASVYQAVSQLRKLLGDVDPVPSYIVTVPRKGYRLVARVRRVPAEGILLTADTVVARAPATAFRGRRRVPLMLGVVAPLAFILVGILIWTQLANYQPVAESSASIVVLPFIDLTAEKANQSFCDGLTEELSNRLSQIPTLRVVARTSAFAFRGRDEDVRMIGKELDSNHILEGSVRRSGNHIRVTVQLIDAQNGYHLWSADYDTTVDDAIKIQEDISKSVAENLLARLGIVGKVDSGMTTLSERPNL